MLVSERYRDPAPDEPLVLALFSFRYDAHLVPGLVTNLRPAVHGHIAWDDRAADAAMSSEPARRNALLAEARRQGARWILACDPDERYEERLAERIPEMIAAGEGTIWRFAYREMFDPDAYRLDGIWGGKSVVKFFALSAAVTEIDTALHGSWVANEVGLRQADSRLNIYHMRMAHPYRRRMRRALYAAADPERAFQAVGYDYLDDERGMELEQIEPARRYSPPFEDDGGLWAPDPGEIGQGAPDPFEARLSFAARSLPLPGGSLQAALALDDLAQASPADPDLPHAAARLFLRAGAPDEALRRAENLLSADPSDLHALLLRAQAAGRLGDTATAEDSLSRVEAALPGSPLARLLRHQLLPAQRDLAAPDAIWRQRAGAGQVQIFEGARVPADAPICVVVLGFRAQPALRDAVASVLSQEGAAEVVVVNTGGGNAAGLLTGMLDRIRLIEVEEPHFVGAARNIGVDASRAPLVAFLAGDCTAAPGWLSARLRAHAGGAAMVSTPVLPADPGSLTGAAAHYLRYSIRHPETPQSDRSHFGRSYARWILQDVGPFPPGLRVSEDAELNRMADQIARPVWEAGAVTLHRDPDLLATLLADERSRGMRKADHPPYRAMAGLPDAAQLVADRQRPRLEFGRKGAARWSGLSGAALRALQVQQWLAVQADQAGILTRLAELAQADAAAARAAALREEDPAAALGLAEAALSEDGQDWRKAQLVGDLRAALGLAGAEKAWAAAAALAPWQPAPLRALCTAQARAGDRQGALARAEEAVARHPQVREFWDLASDTALKSGLAHRTVAYRRAALALAPASVWVHRRLALAHKAAGQPLAEAFRALSDRRLTAWSERRKARAAALHTP